MNKKPFSTLLATALLALGAASSAHAELATCGAPLTSAIGERWCYESFGNLEPGMYNVSFQYQAEMFSGNSDKTLTAGFLFDSIFGPESRGVITDSTSTTGWNTYSFEAQAGGASGLLVALRGVPGTPYGMAIRDVQVAPVPEPSTYAMMAAGLGALAFVSRRRRPNK